MIKLLLAGWMICFLFLSLGLSQEDPKVTAQKVYNEGLTLLKKNQTAQAIEKLKEATTLDPTLAVAYYALGIAYKNTKDLATSEDMFKKAIEKDDKYSAAYNALGLLYNSQQRYDSAINTFKAALGINPNDEKANFGLGSVYLQQKDYRNAIQYFKKAVEIQAEYSNAWENLGICHHEIREYEAAITAFGNALQYEKKKTEKSGIYLRLGNSLAKLERDEEAIQAYSSAIEGSTQSYIQGAAHFGMGEIYKKNGDKQQAQLHFEAASKDRSWKQPALYEIDMMKKQN